MKIERLFMVGMVVLLVLFIPNASAAVDCPADSALVGQTCIDNYEASVWETTDPLLIEKIKNGTVTLANLTASGAVQLGTAADDYGSAGCSDNGTGCLSVYVVSIAGVLPAHYITYFQMLAALRNSGKRLPYNQEWQMAALGTPDPGGSGDDDVTTCNITSDTFLLPEDPVLTGSRSLCVSDAGVYDMVGNVTERVAEWVPRSTGCGSWGSFSEDAQCLVGAQTTGKPGALMRGGSFDTFNGGGAYQLRGDIDPTQARRGVGFRGAR